MEKLIQTVTIKQIDPVYLPQIRHHIDYVEVATPMTNNYYLGQLNGELYGLDHGMARFDAWTQARLRPKTDIPGLFVTGQDILRQVTVSTVYFTSVDQPYPQFHMIYTLYFKP